MSFVLLAPLRSGTNTYRSFPFYCHFNARPPHFLLVEFHCLKAWSRRLPFSAFFSSLSDLGRSASEEVDLTLNPSSARPAVLFFRLAPGFAFLLPHFPLLFPNFGLRRGFPGASAERRRSFSASFFWCLKFEIPALISGNTHYRVGTTGPP